MCSEQLVDDMVINECGVKVFCEICAQGKMTRMPFPKESSNKSMAVLDLIHSDVCEPDRNVSSGGHKYVLTFIDDFSRCPVIYLLKHKSDVERKLKEYIEFVKNNSERNQK